MATRKGLHRKGSHYLLVLEWIGWEDLVNDFADWVQGDRLEGPVFAFDAFERQESFLGTAPRPDNYPAPEPSARLRVQVGFDDIPQPASVIVLGPHTPRKVANSVIKAAPEGCYVIFEAGSVGVARDCIPALYCGDQVGVILL